MELKLQLVFRHRASPWPVSMRFCIGLLLPDPYLDEERILVLDADDPFPPDEWPTQAANVH